MKFIELTTINPYGHNGRIIIAINHIVSVERNPDRDDVYVRTTSACEHRVRKPLDEVLELIIGARCQD